MSEAGTQPAIGPSYGDLAALIAHQIPAVTIGMTEAENLNEPDESVMIDPIFTGVAQLLALIRDIDNGRAKSEEEPIS